MELAVLGARARGNGPAAQHSLHHGVVRRAAGLRAQRARPPELQVRDLALALGLDAREHEVGFGLRKRRRRQQTRVAHALDPLDVVHGARRATSERAEGVEHSLQTGHVGGRALRALVLLAPLLVLARELLDAEVRGVGAGVGVLVVVEAVVLAHRARARGVLHRGHRLRDDLVRLAGLLRHQHERDDEIFQTDEPVGVPRRLDARAKSSRHGGGLVEPSAPRAAADQTAIAQHLHERLTLHLLRVPLAERAKLGEHAFDVRVDRGNRQFRLPRQIRLSARLDLEPEVRRAYAPVKLDGSANLVARVVPCCCGPPTRDTRSLMSRKRSPRISPTIATASLNSSNVMRRRCAASPWRR